MTSTFEIKDLLMAAFLQVRGHRLLDLRPDGAGRAVFVFGDGEQTREDAKAFLEDAPTAIPVRSLGRRVANLRSRCRELKRRDGPMELRSNGERVSE